MCAHVCECLTDLKSDSHVYHMIQSSPALRNRLFSSVVIRTSNATSRVRRDLAIGKKNDFSENVALKRSPTKETVK